MSQIQIGDYLFRRVRELGVKSVFGVPGDYELALLDLIPSNGLEWKGNPNELVASYAADGYARINGCAAFVSTFGPGELSAYCGVGGQYCEYVPVVHIIGYPSTTAIKAKAIMHHTLGDGRFDMFEAMTKHITVATTVLSPESAASEIDRVLTTMLYESRPVYIGVPTDIVYTLISDASLSKPLIKALPQDDPDVIKNTVKTVRGMLEKAVMPAIIVDGCATRNNALDEVDQLLKLLELPTFLTAMGKGAINEEFSFYGGVYGGAGTHPEVKTAIESSDIVLWIGRYGSDFNTGEFTMNIAEEKVIDLQRFWATIGGNKIDVKMKYFLQALIKDLKEKPLTRTKETSVTWNPYPLASMPAAGSLTQDFLWATLGRVLRSGDVVIGETGTSAFGIADSRFPLGTFAFNQTVWGSIGYATGAAVGAFTAIAESNGKHKRGILVTGEGSMHLTAQAIADMLRYNLKPIIFVLNNGGYTVERLIHGKDASYNEVAHWDYSALAKTLGPRFQSKYYGPIKTAQELVKLVDGPELQSTNCFQLVELILGPLDAPKSVLLTGAAIEEFNKPKA